MAASQRLRMHYVGARHHLQHRVAPQYTLSEIWKRNMCPQNANYCRVLLTLMTSAVIEGGTLAQMQLPA
jgi:hypothetical protein